MGFRFRKNVKVAPGVRLNLSKTGVSVTLGTRGANLNIGRRGTTATIGLPGSGFHYTKRLGGASERKPTERKQALEAPDDKLKLGFFQRLTTADNKEAFVDGLRDYLNGDERAAKQHWEEATGIADAAFLAGCLAINEGDFASATQDLEQALVKSDDLGKQLQACEMELSVGVPITDDMEAQVQADVRGVRLALVEAYQGAGRLNEAIAQLEALVALDPDDVVTKMSLAELRMEAAPDDPANLQSVVKLAEGVTNETPYHAALMLYRATALRKLGLRRRRTPCPTRCARRRIIPKSFCGRCATSAS
jgi:tetratricopeptide (TPR) repeat protein